MKSVLKSQNRKIVTLGRVLAILLFVAVLAGTWDAWWHGAIGRDSFWEPPHILLYSSILLAVILGIYGYLQTKEKRWRTLALVLVLIPVSGPFDELWHRMFGVEDLSSPFIVWSPPHMAIIFSIMASMILLLPILRKDSRDMQVLLGSMIFAALLNLILFLFAPLQPEGPWHLVGFFGPFFATAGIVGILMLAQRWIPFRGAPILTAVFFLSIAAIGFNEKMAEGVTILPHDHPPAFLTVSAILLKATIVSVLKTPGKSALAGFVWTGIIYGFSWIFFKPEFKYGFSEGLIAIISGIAGAILIGILFEKWRSKQ